MRNGLALLTLSLVGVLFGTASCGKDEATGGGSSTGHVGYCQSCSHTSDCADPNVCRVVQGKLGVCAKSTDTQCCEGAAGSTSGTCYTNLGPNIDGAGGSAGGGIINNGGKAGRGGSGGTGVVPQTRLGQACVSNGDCVTAGLECLTEDSLPGEQGPAGGLCTAPCASNADCEGFGTVAYCYTLAEQPYCIEGCPVGAFDKCHDRVDVACTPLTNQAPCTSDSACSPGICDADSGVCLFGGCVPACGADSQCGSGQSCDFSTGLCSSNPKEGLGFGAPCNTRETNDPCAGFCIRVSETGGMCSASCSQNLNLYGCGFDGSGPADAVCAFRTADDFASIGDLGICGPLCDCNAECELEGWGCFDLDDQLGTGAQEYFGRKGICLTRDENDQPSDTLQQCPNGSGGGAGAGGEGGGGGTGGSGGTSDGGQSGSGGEGGS